MNMLNMTPEQFLADAQNKLAAVTDESPTQMHRRAIAGKNLIVHRHNWDKWAFEGRGGIAVSIRVRGQYTDRARNVFTDRAERDAYANQLDVLIAGVTA